MIDAKRCYGPCFRVLVRNLPQIINNTQLQHLFNKNGSDKGIVNRAR
jgi:hypothetical protein